MNDFLLRAGFAPFLGGLLLMTGCEAPASGLCDDRGNTDGFVDVAGDVYNLRIYNCGDQDIFVTINDRNVGIVSAYNPDSGFCGVTDLGTFPQCTTGVIAAYAYELHSSTIEWNEFAVTENPNGCWVSRTFVNVDTGFPEGAELPVVEPTVTSEMLCTGLTVTDLL